MPESETVSSSSTMVGFNLVVLGSVFLALQNVILRVMFARSEVFGRYEMGGLVTPSLTNALLLLLLRTGLMAALLGVALPWLYPSAWRELRLLPTNGPLLRRALASGVTLALGLTLLYVSLSYAAAGVAIAVFFLHPALVVLLAALVWREQPSPWQVGLIVLILSGVGLTTWDPSATTSSNLWLGSAAALGAAIIYAISTLLAQTCLQPQRAAIVPPDSIRILHPTSFSLLSFTVIMAVTGMGLGLLPAHLPTDSWSAIWVFSLACALLAVFAYLMLNYGIKLIGASLSALVSASTPVMTALFAWISLHETLHSWQMIGVVLVTLGVAGLSRR